MQESIPGSMQVFAEFFLALCYAFFGFCYSLIGSSLVSSETKWSSLT